MSSDRSESHFVASLIIPSSFSSCEMSAAKHHNRRLQSAALLPPTPQQHIPLGSSHIYPGGEAKRILKGTQRPKKVGEKRWMKMKEKSRTPPHIISRHFLPMISQGNQVVVGRRENTLLHTSGNVLTGITRHAILHELGKRKKKHIIMSSMVELKTSRGLYKCPPANLFHLAPLITYNSLREDD